MIFLLLTLSLFPVSHGQGSVPPLVASPAAPLSAMERDQILSRLKDRISVEDRQFEAEGKSRKKELVRSQNDRRKAWRDSERKLRRAFFESHSSGPDRRKYVQDFVRRKVEYDRNEKNEWVAFNQRQKEERESLRKKHSELDRQVKDGLGRNERPAW
jgi:hypothetical protein